MRKKFLYFILASVMTVSLLTGCGNGEQASGQTGENVTAESTEGVGQADKTEQADTEDKADQEDVVDAGDSTVDAGQSSEGEIASGVEGSSATDSEVAVHAHEYTCELTLEPTCDTKGMWTYTCSCGDVYTEETSYMDHCTDRSEITKEPTCEEEGIEAFYCIFCGREIYTEKIAKLPHTESCNHESVETETTLKPKDYTYTQYIKILFVVGPTHLYSSPCEGYEYAELEYGTAVPVISKCDQDNYYIASSGVLISGKNLSEERPIEYVAAGGDGWENFVEEITETETYWSGIYRKNGLELHVDHWPKYYAERCMNYVETGLYTLTYRDMDTQYWSGSYDLIIENNGGRFSDFDYMHWIETYMEANGIKTSVSSVGKIEIYRMPVEEGAKRLYCASVCVLRE